LDFLECQVDELLRKITDDPKNRLFVKLEFLIAPLVADLSVARVAELAIREKNYHLVGELIPEISCGGLLSQ
jgi:hypothetical protein